MLPIGIVILVLAASTYGQSQLTVFDNGKLCTPWIPLTGGTITFHYTNNGECMGPVLIDQGFLQIRFCCQAATTGPATGPTVDPTIASTTLTPIAPRECGIRKLQTFKTRIIGGVEANRNSWPWQARLLTGCFQCSGVLIDARHVLVSAHCFDIPLKLFHQVHLGAHNINQPTFIDEKIFAERVFIHEEFDPATIRNDIALIRLSRPATLSDAINPICLPGPEAQVNDTVWVAGWGAESAGGALSPVLMETSLQVMPAVCEKAYPEYDNVKQMCAGAYGGGRDSCTNDGGAPLVYESNGQWFLNGIVSGGGSVCGQDGFPGTYTRISYYLPWIMSKIAS